MEWVSVQCSDTRVELTQLSTNAVWCWFSFLSHLSVYAVCYARVNWVICWCLCAISQLPGL